MVNYKTIISCFLIMAALMFSREVRAGELKGELKWPKEWVVFAPLHRADPVLKNEVFRSVPESIHLPKRGSFPARDLKDRRIAVEPGKVFDFSGLFEKTANGNAAYVFFELQSPVDQIVTIGMGADWWFQVWLNGKEVFDTLETGNMGELPFSAADHKIDVPLKKGANVLVVRVISGNNMSLSIGGPDEIRTAEKRDQEREWAFRFNHLPEKFEDRMLFPVDEQAVAMARRGLTLPETDADLSTGALVGLQEMPKRQLRFYPITHNRCQVIDAELRRFPDPVTIQLSKYRYPWEDKHLDTIVWMTPAKEGDPINGRLEVTLKDADGAKLAVHTIEELSPNGLFFSIGFPEALRGKEGTLQITWRDGERILGDAQQKFLVNAASNIPETGKIPLQILNGPGVTMTGAPMTVGVPFPRGALFDENHVKLVDDQGKEFPLQTKVDAKWSRFGSVKWLLCDFTVDLKGKPETLFLEYGPDIKRMQAPRIVVKNSGQGFPQFKTGRLSINAESLAVDFSGKNNFENILSSAALSGAFVTHENGRTYSMPAEGKCVIEESGSEKVVVRRTGWYSDDKSGDKFCQFVTRFVFHRNSPVVRIFHTWIYTGDDKKDRIRNMGWRFPTASASEPEGFLTSFMDGKWKNTESLVQFDYKTYLLPVTGEELSGKTPGIMSGTVGSSRVIFGAKDFWQNFPSELEANKNGFVFYNWPKRNPAARLERPVNVKDAFRNRFVHEGKLLDFKLPEEYVNGPIWEGANSRELHWAKDRPETANAQGIARTEEMFLYFTDKSSDVDVAAGVLKGLNDETLRAVVDPEWVCDSGTFSVGGDIHHKDVKKYPEEERIIDLTYKAPPRWLERFEFYGMWLHGDYPHWKPKLTERTADVYRTLAKNHHTWPYRWTPFARSGDPELLKLAEAATRQMSDAYFCHYATADVDKAVGPEYFRSQGWWDRSLLPWAARRGPASRSYTMECDYLWHSWYMTGYTRARDVALLFGELTKKTFNPTAGPRGSSSWLSSYLDMYSATFDPWYLSAIYELAKLYEHKYGKIRNVDKNSFVPGYEFAGHNWRGEQQKLYLFTGDDEHRRLALNNALAWGSPRRVGNRLVGARVGAGAPPHFSAFAWSLTGDEFQLKRTAAALDMLKIAVYEGEVDYLRGIWRHFGHAFLPLRNARWDGPAMALAAIEKAGHRPEPMHNPFPLLPIRLNTYESNRYSFRLNTVYVRKTGSKAVPLFIDALGRTLYNNYPFPYEFTHLENSTKLSGTWTPAERIQIPADAPKGTYRLDFRGSVPYGKEGESITNVRRNSLHRRVGMVFFPLGNPETPEVITFEPSPEGTTVGAGMQGYCFMVPKGVKEFWIKFGGGFINRYSVWSPDGKRIYDVFGSEKGSATGNVKIDVPLGEEGKIKITVPPGQDGKLWRATGGGFMIDPAIPPYFAVTREKWFMPEDADLEK